MNATRSLAPAARHALRLTVITMRRAGATYSEIAARTGLSRTGVFDICARHEAGGDAALHDQPAALARSYARRLSPLQEDRMRQFIIDSAPDALALIGRLWSAAAVAGLIAQQLHIHLSVRTLGAYLLRWDFVARPSLRYPPTPSAPAGQRWMRDSYPAVAARCRAEDARILWTDHSPLASPGAELAMTSSVDNRRQMRWAIYPGVLADTGLVDFMQRLLVGADRKLVLLMTDSPVLHGEFITQWLGEQEDVIELLALPGWQVGATFK